MGERSILIAGIGGQGVVFAATALAKALFLQGLYVAQLQSYGAEVRGGVVLAWVVYSEERVSCPFTDEYDLALILHQAGLEEAARKNLAWRRAVVDSDLVGAEVPGDVDVYPVHRMAVEAGLEGRENIVMLGVAAGLGYVDLSHLERALASSRGSEENLRALRLGVELAARQK